MSEQKTDFQVALQRVCNGTQVDFQFLIREFGPQIKMVVRRRLNQRMRSKFDSGDFVQMVWVSFFANWDSIKRIDTPKELLAYLVKMAQNKVVEESRRCSKSAKRNVNLERPLKHAEGNEARSQRRTDTPSQIAIAREQFNNLVHNQSERDRRVVDMRMNGATFDEISETLGIHERTARKIISNLKMPRAD